MKSKSKKNLLSEAIADAKAVRETALANAKLALEEAFTPKLQSMISAKLQQEMDDEDMEGEDEELAAMEDELEGGDEYAEMEGEEEYAEMEDEMGGEDELAAMEDEMEDELGEGDYASMEDDEDLEENATDEEEYQSDGYAAMDGDEAGDEHMEDGAEAEGGDVSDEYEDEELNLEAIIKELEDEMGGDEEAEDLEEGDGYDEGDPDADIHTEEDELEGDDVEDEDEDINIDEIINALREDDSFTGDGTPDGDADEESQEEEAMKEELEEAYDTIKQMQATLKEVNLLNAKLMFSNKLFRAYDLNEAQKVKVIEHFDRAGTTREVKLVFATLAESFRMPAKRKLKESRASKPAGSTKPSKKTVLTEGQVLANRFQKLANIKPKKK